MTDCPSRLTAPCYFDDTGCVVCPGVAGTPGRPATVVTIATTGWLAGANSILTLPGNCHTVFGFNYTPATAIVGLKKSRDFTTDPTRLDYAMMFVADETGAMSYTIVESGLTVAGSFSASVDESLTIGRVGNQVLYVQAGSVVYKSTKPSLGPLLVNACLYATGDAIA